MMLRGSEMTIKGIKGKSERDGFASEICIGSGTANELILFFKAHLTSNTYHSGDRRGARYRCRLYIFFWLIAGGFQKENKKNIGLEFIVRKRNRSTKS